MPPIRHVEESRDSLYHDITDALSHIFVLWQANDDHFKFVIPVLCALRLEAFINVAGKVNISNWDTKERKLSFKSKCETICKSLNLKFDSNADPNRTALQLFEIRNQLAHPKLVRHTTDELITQAEYEKRRTMSTGIEHPLRSQLSRTEIIRLVECTEQFFQAWSTSFLQGYPDYWLRWGSSGGFSEE